VTPSSLGCRNLATMLLYLDSSALAKRYLLEIGSQAVETLIDDIDLVAASVVTLPEVMSAIRRTWANGRLDEVGAEAARAAFRRDWAAVMVLPADVATIARAATMVWEHQLRGFDAVHLASAHRLSDRLGEPVTFATFDRHLWRAARDTGLVAWPADLGD